MAEFVLRKGKFTKSSIHNESFVRDILQDYSKNTIYYRSNLNIMINTLHDTEIQYSKGMHYKYATLTNKKMIHGYITRFLSGKISDLIQEYINDIKIQQI